MISGRKSIHASYVARNLAMVSVLSYVRTICYCKPVKASAKVFFALNTKTNEHCVDVVVNVHVLKFRLQ